MNGKNFTRALIMAFFQLQCALNVTTALGIRPHFFCNISQSDFMVENVKTRQIEDVRHHLSSQIAWPLVMQLLHPCKHWILPVWAPPCETSALGETQLRPMDCSAFVLSAVQTPWEVNECSWGSTKTEPQKVHDDHEYNHHWTAQQQRAYSICMQQSHARAGAQH